jgi:hypothetical protein
MSLATIARINHRAQEGRLYGLQLALKADLIASCLASHLSHHGTKYDLAQRLIAHHRTDHRQPAVVRSTETTARRREARRLQAYRIRIFRGFQEGSSPQTIPPEEQKWWQFTPVKPGCKDCYSRNPAVETTWRFLLTGPDQVCRLTDDPAEGYGRILREAGRVVLTQQELERYFTEEDGTYVAHRSEFPTDRHYRIAHYLGTLVLVSEVVCDA